MKNEHKKILWNTIGSTVNALSSLVFLIIVTRINGINEAGIFSYSFATACLFFAISIYSTRAFQATDIQENNSDSDYLYNRVTTSLIMMIIAIIFCLLREYDIRKSLILILLCLFKCIETLEETFYAIFQKNEHLDFVGKSMTIRAISTYLIFLLIDIITKSLPFSIMMLNLYYLFFLIIYDQKYLKKLKFTKTKFSLKKNKELLKAGFNTFLFSFLSLYVINAPRYAIDTYLTEEMQTVFGIIVMPATVMSLLSQFIIHPFLTKISKSFYQNQEKEVKKIVFQLLTLMGLLGLGIILCACFLGIPVLEILYGMDLKEYKFSFLLIMVGALFYGFSILMSYVLIALRKTFCQVFVVLITAVVAGVLSAILVKNYFILGASISYLSAMLLEAILYFTLLKYQLRNIKEMRSEEKKI